jgi:hypothetical protein
MSVIFALDMTIGPRVSTSGPTCRAQKIAILLRVSYKIFSNSVTKSTHSNPVFFFKFAIPVFCHTAFYGTFRSAVFSISISLFLCLLR